MGKAKNKKGARKQQGADIFQTKKEHGPESRNPGLRVSLEQETRKGAWNSRIGKRSMTLTILEHEKNGKKGAKKNEKGVRKKRKRGKGGKVKGAGIKWAGSERSS